MSINVNIIVTKNNRFLKMFKNVSKIICFWNVPYVCWHTSRLMKFNASKKIYFKSAFYANLLFNFRSLSAVFRFNCKLSYEKRFKYTYWQTKILTQLLRQWKLVHIIQPFKFNLSQTHFTWPNVFLAKNIIVLSVQHFLWCTKVKIIFIKFVRQT